MQLHPDFPRRTGRDTYEFSVVTDLDEQLVFLDYVKYVYATSTHPTHAAAAAAALARHLGLEPFEITESEIKLLLRTASNSAIYQFTV